MALARLGSMRAVARGAGHHHVHRVASSSRRSRRRRGARCWSRWAGTSGSPRRGGGSPTTASRSWPRSRPPASTSTRRRAGRHRAHRGVRHRHPPLARSRCCRSCAAPVRGCGCVVAEHEPEEALTLIAQDRVDLALVYDYTPALRLFDDRVRGDAAVDRAVGPRRARRRPGPGAATRSRRSRATATTSGSSTPATTPTSWRWPRWPRSAGFTPTVRHRSDSLDLLQDMIVAGLGVGLLPQDGPTRDGVRVLPLRDPDVRLRAHAVGRPRSHGMATARPSAAAACGIRPGRTASWRAPRRRGRRRSAGPRAGRCRPSTRPGCTGAPRRPRAARA